MAQNRVGVGAESAFKLLHVDLPIFIENVRVHLRNHVDLRVSGIALCGLQVDVVELQLVGSAGMPEGVKDHIGEIRFLL